MLLGTSPDRTVVLKVRCLRTLVSCTIPSLVFAEPCLLATVGRSSGKTKLVLLIKCDFLFAGSSGIIVRLSTNHFRLTSRPQWALYQYHIDYNPLMEARRLRSALLFQHEDLIGRCHAFDGTILFLPKRLQHKVI